LHITKTLMKHFDPDIALLHFIFDCKAPSSLCPSSSHLLLFSDDDKRANGFLRFWNFLVVGRQFSRDLRPVGEAVVIVVCALE